MIRIKSDSSIDVAFWERYSGSYQTYPSGVVLFQQSTITQEVFMVCDGLVKLVRTEVNGAEAIVGLRSEGALLGAVSLLAEKPHSFTAVSVSKCSVFRLLAPKFLQMLQDNSHYARSLCKGFASEIVEHITLFSELACLPARLRLEHFLWDNIKDQEGDMAPGQVRLRLPLRECDVAQIISVTPVHLSRLMSEIEKEGIVMRRKSELLVDLRRLRRRDA